MSKSLKVEAVRMGRVGEQALVKPIMDDILETNACT